MLWTEKYRPRTLSDVVGQESFKLDAENWVEIKDMPNLLAFGPPGTGKTGAALALARDMLGDNFDVNLLELNASDDRKLEVVRTHIKDFVSHGKMGNVPFRIILLDEVDGMTADAQNALKRIMERYESNARFILTANDRSRIIYALQSRCANYFFGRVSDEVVTRTVMEILRKEGRPTPPPEDLAHLITSYEGDLRRVITELQAALASGSTLRVQVDKGLVEYDNILSLILNKQYDNALTALKEESLKGKTVRDVCIGLHDVVEKSDMDSKMKYRMLRVIGESEWRSATVTPRILFGWMVANMKGN